MARKNQQMINMAKHVTAEIEGRVLALRGLNYSHSCIVQQLKSENIIISARTVSNIINKIGRRRENKDFQLKRARTVRSKSTIEKVQELINQTNAPSQTNMANAVGCSRRSVQRMITEDLGLRRKRKTEVHKLNERQIQCRKTNSRKLTRNQIRESNFENLVTLDEAWIYSSHCESNKFYYAPRGQATAQAFVKDKCPQNLPKLMVVGIITGRGVIPLKFVPPKIKINGQFYVDKILKPMVKKWLPKLYPEGLCKVFVHHDAATSHTCK